MEKYSVVVDDEKVKMAGTKKCPSCGADLTMDIHAKDADPPRCPACGSTEAYEKHPDKK
jgi:ribosomal protein S27AE